MKEKITNFTICFIISLIVFFIFKNNIEVANIIIKAVNLFFKKVFVSLFPMFIINDLLIGLNFPYYFYLLFNKLFKKIFKTSGICAYVFIMSLISGTPSNAYILKNLVNENKLTNEEANHYLYFTYFSNPLFLTMMLSLIFPKGIVFKLIIVHYISNLILGFLIRNKAPLISDNNLTFKNNNLSKILIESINKAISTLLLILGTIVFYMLLSFIISSFIHNNLFNTLISGFLEITNGLNLLANLSINLKLKEIMAISIISFGGLSINTQIKAILEDTNLKYSSFLKGRIMGTIISAFLTCII